MVDQSIAPGGDSRFRLVVPATLGQRRMRLSWAMLLVSMLLLGCSPRMVHVEAGEDGGEGALANALQALRPREATTAPGLEAEYLEQSTLMPVVAKHLAARNASLLAISRWTHYFAVYEALLEPLRHKAGATVVEIGVQCGGSAQIWAEWLGPEVTIVVVDVDESSGMFQDWPNIVFLLGDQEDPGFWRDRLFPLTGPIDALIDDGAHSYLGQAMTVREALPWVKPGGFLAIEDTHSSYFAPSNVCLMTLDARVMHLAATLGPKGGPSPVLTEACSDVVPWTFMDEMRSLVDVLHAWWFDASGSVEEAMRRAQRFRRALFSPEWYRWFTRSVRSIEFHDSIVVVRRWPASGTREAPRSAWGGRVMLERYPHLQPVKDKVKVHLPSEMVHVSDELGAQLREMVTKVRHIQE
jgi:hypothetical protein